MIEFRVDESDQQIVRLACRVIKDELKKEEVPSAPLPSDQPNPNSTSKASNPVIESPPLSTPISNSSLTSSHVSIDMTDSNLQPSAKPDISHKGSNELDDFITKLYEASILDSDSLDSRVCLDFWDFAGQKPFQALGRMFFDDERCCFIVVFDARKVLQNETFTDIFCDEDGKDLDLETSSTTYVANFEKWLNLIHQVAGEDSPVYVVRELPRAPRGQAHAQREHARACRTTSQRKNRCADAFQKQLAVHARACCRIRNCQDFQKKGKRKPTCHFPSSVYSFAFSWSVYFSNRTESYLIFGRSQVYRKVQYEGVPIDDLRIVFEEVLPYNSIQLIKSGCQ